LDDEFDEIMRNLLDKQIIQLQMGDDQGVLVLRVGILAFPEIYASV
jgi:hypothetical protein